MAAPRLLPPEGELATWLEAEGRAMHELATRLYPIPRSITGDGVRQTLAILRETVPLEVREVPSGTQVFDWTVPKEWNVREAWIRDPDGRKVVDFADHSLHLVGYSVPVHERLPLARLRERLHTLPEQPELIPYRTSYYSEDWGFCLPHRVLEGLPEGEYEVRIDATLEDGSLTYGELAIPGQSGREVLVSCHVCHPALANDNLSGIAVTLHLAKRLLAASREAPLRYGYRFLWLPGTIGAIAWLATNRDATARIAHGLVAANLGDSGPLHYKRCRRGHAEIDRAVEHLLRSSGEPHKIERFVPYGYDERQYCSPGFDLPVGSLTRTPWGRYPEYHTSADDLSFIGPGNLADSLGAYLRVMATLESNRRYRNLNPHCEPQLGRRGLYPSVGGAVSSEEARQRQLALLWVLNQSDGHRDLIETAERSGLPFDRIREAAAALLAAGLLDQVEENEAAGSRP
jgi:aminopeptidase-like protein